MSPPAIAGPGPSKDPPRAGTSLTVLYGPTLSKSQITFPSAVEYARRCPSTDPENTTPGMELTAADCAGLQRLRSPQPAGGVYQARSPLSSLNANIPPPCLGSAFDPRLFGMLVRTMSESAT